MKCKKLSVNIITQYSIKQLRFPLSEYRNPHKATKRRCTEHRPFSILYKLFCFISTYSLCSISVCPSSEGSRSNGFILIIEYNLPALLTVICFTCRSGPIVSAQGYILAHNRIRGKEEFMRLRSEKDGSAALDDAFFHFTVTYRTFHFLASFHRIDHNSRLILRMIR